MRCTDKSFVSAQVFDASWYAVRPLIRAWADMCTISTYGQSEVFLAGINGDKSVMRSRLVGAELKLANVTYRLGQFAAAIARSDEDRAAYMAAVAMGGALRQLKMYGAAKIIWRVVRGMKSASVKAAA